MCAPVVVASKYLLTVYLMETFFTGNGQRVFNMTIVGTPAAPTTIDVFQLAGGKGLPSTFSTTFTATASRMNVTFVKLVDQVDIRGELQA
jgi:Malectin domain